MRKRLYWILFTSFTAFFLFISALVVGFYGFKPEFTTEKLVTYLIVVIVVIAFISYVIAFKLLKRMIEPFNQFSNYLAKNILNYPDPKKDITESDEIVELLKKYGYNFDEIEKGIQLLKENSKARREFSANVSHELKSPLTSINGYAEMIASGMSHGEDTQEFARRIYIEGNRLLKLIDETIELSKLDSNHITNETFETFDIGKIIKDNIESLSFLAEEKDMKIDYFYEPVEYYGNPKLIYDLVANLISNAIKYSSDKKPRLDIFVDDTLENVVLTFKDNGIGISRKDQERIFERFYVAEKSRGKKSGTGLGLSLVKNIVQFHKGSIDLESDLGKGSTFKIKLSKTINID
ncbi:hypothetical protein HMPREF9709_00118 [Helcococcus kunzii ATCC 51366]|uniref:histidine kinase n=1 Tax=Helcococcus kunzii ATCC 51366 TaxID=883114 RepID=H3NLE1_9FIRM|nr:HAMP domain-containing sensor histidine kinase [Helcococcus kunzii]EHR36022.1 hypothetical protein HMPREF9709_00118 [Helcococcus kunzii ATCC 51366]